MKKGLTFILLLLISGLIFAQNNYWSDINENQISVNSERYIVPDVYRTVSLNVSELKSYLAFTPLEFTNRAMEGKYLISLPMPDGTFQDFNFWESPTMEAELQEQFPEIRTYTGQGIDDPFATLKFDFTPLGFHAQILSPNGRVFIDPYSLQDIENYISYYTKDFRKFNDNFSCELYYHNEYQQPENLNENFSYEAIGPQLRTYRLANAATGEYTQFFGGSVSYGLAAVTTTVNRVNGVYEREVGIRMILVGNNNLIIYTNPSTDPYTNNSGSTMLGQNISNLNSVIGSSNYDIGHVFSTGGGGVAYLGCVCTSSKAGGVTGSSSPVGDPFDIDYVAHEMGHQFGANHTFNGTLGSCSGSNRNASTAYEPGSGSTIMAYAGICNGDDLQPHSDVYFHTISYSEIVAYTNSGSGNSCAVISNTGNNAPVVTVPAGGFYIPKSTPFALTGSATDPNGDALTYCWEEFDLGPAGSPNSPSGTAPIFRSWSPSSSPTRTFPRPSDLINNTTVIGEILPTYSRAMNFRLTARDNKAGGGGVDYKQMSTFYVDGNSGPFIVTSPNTNVSWYGNSQQTITWNVANTSSSPVNCSNVKILLSTDGGYNFNTVLVASTPNDGSEIVTIPNTPTSQARIKVEAVGNIFFDISNTNFTIVNNPAVNDPSYFNANTVSDSQINLFFVPNSNNNNVIIVWNLGGSFTTPSGAPPAVGGSFAGGTLLYNGINSPVYHTGLTPATTYYYKAFSYNGISYSPGLTVNAATPSSLDFGVELLLTDICSNSIQLVFGTAPGATDCFDEGLDVEAPPPPPFDAFDGRFSICGYHLFTDIRGTNPGGERVWNILYQTASECQPINFSWDPAQLPPNGYFHLVDQVYGNLVNVNMRTLNHFTNLPELDRLRIRFNYQINSRYNMASGWNMISLPINVTNNNYLTLFPNAVSGTLYRYSNSYMTSDTVENGIGYWLKFSSSQIADVLGLDRTESVLNLSAGWNLIGGPYCNVSLSSVIDPGEIIIPGTLYSYSGSYTNAASIDPTKAYWIKTNSAGTITISCSVPPLSLNKELAFISEITSDFKKIDISDAVGNSQMLYFGNKLETNKSIESFSMPPLPPPGSFDARITGDYRLSESDEVTISVQTDNYPVSIFISDLEETNQIKYVLQEIVGGKVVNSHPVIDGDKIVITNKEVSILKLAKQEDVPIVYSLEQNYPNPFNPLTTIKFSLPEAAEVNLSIFNTLGEKLAELVNTDLAAGYYNFQWDAGNIASGIYIYQLKTNKFVSVKKMLLLK